MDEGHHDQRHQEDGKGKDPDEGVEPPATFDAERGEDHFSQQGQDQKLIGEVEQCRKIGVGRRKSCEFPDGVPDTLQRDERKPEKLGAGAVADPRYEAEGSENEEGANREIERPVDPDALHGDG